MTSPTRCPECDAPIREESHKFCAFCGARLPEPPPAPGGPTASLPTAPEARRARFERLAEHPSAKSALATPPSGDAAVAAQGASSMGLVVLLVIFGGMAFVFLTVRSRFIEPAIDTIAGQTGFGGTAGTVGHTILNLQTLVLLVIGGSLVYGLVKALRTTSSAATSPVRSRLVRVADEHVELRGTGEHKRSVHVASFEEASGHRTSYDVSARAARQLAPDDMGVLHTRGRVFIEFDRVDV